MEPGLAGAVLIILILYIFVKAIAVLGILASFCVFICGKTTSERVISLMLIVFCCYLIFGL